MDQSYDVIIVGGGIVGLASAVQIHAQRPSLRILLLEKESGPARHQTGHNSGVLHSGIYYRPGSLKAANCVRGYTQMLRFCQEHGVKHEVCGKIIVATDEQEVLRLNMLKERGEANGLTGVRTMSREEMREREPHVNGIRGLFVPQTGIVDFVEVSETLVRLLSASGVTIRYSEKVIGILNTADGTTVLTSGAEYHCRIVVGCAGLYSDRVAMYSRRELDVRIIPFRGEYYSIKPERTHLVQHLIYPVPDPSFPFLGVHFTRTIHGDVEAGPNAVLAFAREGYSYTDVNISDLIGSLAWPGFRRIAKKYWKTGLGEYYRSLNKRAFVHALQKLVPDITEDDLVEGNSGVRAQACDSAGNLLDDFYFVEQDRAVHVCNAPSPAATSSLSIGEAIALKVCAALSV